MGLKAHVGFAIPDTKDVGKRITAHFNRLGYQAIEHGSHDWVCQRGKRSAVLWRFDIRAYFTTLTVKASPQQDGKIWIGCDWEVYTFMSITTGGDVRTLEAEGRELESALREAA